MNMYFRQKIAAILPWAIAASLVLAPAPLLLMLALYRFAQKHPDWQKVYQYLMISVFALDAIGICIQAAVDNGTYQAPDKTTVSEWLDDWMKTSAPPR